MLSRQIGAILRDGRKLLALTQRDLAKRAQVSERLWAEVERGERPNVSLETALRMLSEVGVSVRLSDSTGSSVELRDAETEKAAKDARAGIRRATWAGKQIRLPQEGTEPERRVEGGKALASTARVSEQAAAIAHMRKARTRA